MPKSLFVFADPVWLQAVEFSIADSVYFTPATSAHAADVIAVFYKDEHVQTLSLERVLSSCSPNIIVITRPTLSFVDLCFMHPNLCSLFYKSYDVSTDMLKNAFDLDQSVVHADFTEIGGLGSSNEVLQTSGMVATIVGEHRFKNLKGKMVRAFDKGVNCTFNDNTLTINSSFPNCTGDRLFSSFTLYGGDSGVVANLTPPSDCDYMERWGASFLYATTVLAYGPREVLDRNRHFSCTISSKLKSIRGASALLL